MEIVLLVIGVVGLIGLLGVAASRYGADTRPRIGDEPRRSI
jgi:hypothetical protein